MAAWLADRTPEVTEQFVPTNAKVTTPVPEPPAAVNVMVDPTVAVRVVFETVRGSCGRSAVPAVNVKYRTGLVALA